MPSVYTNFITGPTAIAGLEPPLTDNITARPIAYMSATLRYVVPFTATGGNAYALSATLPSNFIANGFYVNLVGAATGAPTGVSFTVGNVAGGAQYVPSTTFTADGTTLVALTGTAGAGVMTSALNQILSGEPNISSRTFVITPTATTTGAGTSRLYVYLTGFFVDPVDLPVNT